MNLSSMGLQDQGRYDCINSDALLEDLIGGHDYVHGIAIRLTNEHPYWSKTINNE